MSLVGQGVPLELGACVPGHPIHLGTDHRWTSPLASIIINTGRLTMAGFDPCLKAKPSLELSEFAAQRVPDWL